MTVKASMEQYAIKQQMLYYPLIPVLQRISSSMVVLPFSIFSSSLATSVVYK